MNASVFKTCSKIEGIYDFLKNKEFIEQEATDIPQEHLERKEHKHFEITSDGGLLVVIVYKDNEELREAEKELKGNISVNYLILTKNDFSEYRFYKYDEGTGKTLRLRKKREEFEAVFLKKLESLKYDDLEGFEKIFDRSEFIKEFYQLYCDAEDYLTKNVNGISDEEEREFFAKLIIERVMFLWFLQKKGFLDKNENYFVDKFKQIKQDSKNYYNDFLKKLFLNGLCKKVNERGESIKALLGNVPYLNGGLFIESEIELKYGHSIEIDNKVFYRIMDYAKINSEKNIPVLNLMACKEWTIDERSGEVDKLNPEVLGYIFEKSVNQKDLGAVYTPEEITTYICKNTIYPYIIDKINEKFNAKFEYKGDIKKDLLEHLNKEQLRELFNVVKELRILDPAVGSGHFLVDAIITLELIYNHLWDKEIIKWSGFGIRQHIITENLFGVDILPGAIEICKLRMFLALAETFRSEKDIHPLPNIEFNFRVGNSLMGFVSKNELNQNFMSAGPAVNAITKNMKFLKQHYPELAKKAEQIVANLFNMNPMDLFNIRNELVKSYRTPKDDKEFQIELREVINELTSAFNEELNNQLFKSMKHIFDNDNALEEEYRKLIKKNKDGKFPSKEKLIFEKFEDLAPFHWMMEFSEVIGKGGFDIILENPPYIGFKKMPKFQRNIWEYLYSKIFNGKNDLMYYFLVRHKNLINKTGSIGIITSRYFLEAKYANKLRRYLKEEYFIKQIIDFHGLRPFEKISVDPLLIFFINDGVKGNISIIKFANCAQEIGLKKIFNDIIREKTNKGFDSFFFKQTMLNDEETWVLYSKIQGEILEILNRNKDNLLDDICYIHNGILTALDTVYVLKKGNVKIHDLETQNIKEWVKSSNIRKYKLDWEENYLLYITKDTDLSKFKNTMKYLKLNESEITKRNNKRGEDLGYCLARPKLDVNWSKEKILCPYKAEKNRFAYDNTGKYGSYDCTIILMKERYKQTSIKIILAILNSALMDFWIKLNAKKLLNQYEYYPSTLCSIPIKLLTNSKSDKIIRIVEDIHKQESEKIRKNLFEEIDNLIYKEYNLEQKHIEEIKRLNLIHGLRL